jgi:hypothetical protein
MVEKESMKYLEQNNMRVVRTEIVLMPILIVLPFIVGIALINDWYVRGYLENNVQYLGELFIGLIIIFGNIIFDIPFIRSLLKFFKERKKDP